MANLTRMAQKILHNTNRVDRMVQDFLDTSLIQTGDRLPLKASECDLLLIAQDAIADFTAEEQVCIVFEGPATRGYWDAGLIRRALKNLLGNAIKYGAGHSPITVRLEPEFGRAEISVHNEGNPNSVQDQKIPFEPYHRAPSAKASGKRGWGLKLSLTQGIAHGGSLIVDSSPERGTTFTIDIPEDPRGMQWPPSL